MSHVTRVFGGGHGLRDRLVVAALGTDGSEIVGQRGFRLTGRPGDPKE